MGKTKYLHQKNIKILIAILLLLLAVGTTLAYRYYNRPEGTFIEGGDSQPVYCKTSDPNAITYCGETTQ